MKNIKEEYEYSELYKYTMENVMSKGKEWRTLYTPILFDTNLTLNDKAIYLALLSKVYKVGYKAKKNKNSTKEEVYRGVTQKELGEMTKMRGCNVGRSIDRLIEHEYIITKMNDNKNTFHLLNRFKEDGTKEDFLPLPIDYFHNLCVNKKKFIDTLKIILLSYGNDSIPTLKASQRKFELLSRKEYRRLKKLHDGSSDVTLYKNLIHMEIFEEREDVLPNPILDELQDLLDMSSNEIEEVDELEEEQEQEPIEFARKDETLILPMQKIIEEVEAKDETIELNPNDELSALLDAI